MNIESQIQFGTYGYSVVIQVSLLFGNAEEFFDDVLGFSPQLAYMASGITLSAAMDWGLLKLYQAFAKTPTGIIDWDHPFKDIDTPEFKEFRQNAGEFSKSAGNNVIETIEKGGTGYRILDAKINLIGVYAKNGASTLSSLPGIGINHTAVAIKGLDGKFYNSMTGLRGGNIYGLTGTCHQMANRAIARAGCSIRKLLEQRLVQLCDRGGLRTLWNICSFVKLYGMGTATLKRGKMFANSLFRFIAMILFIIMFLGCGKATITCSTIKTKNEAIETVDRIVNAAFVDMGHGGGDMSRKEGRPYELYLPNKYGKMEMYIYYVSFYESRNRTEVKPKLDSYRVCKTLSSCFHWSWYGDFSKA